MLFVFFPVEIIHIFTKDEGVAAYGSKALRIMGSGFIFYGIGMVMVQSLNGAGDTRTPTYINLVCFWAFQIPFAYFLAMGTTLSTTGAFIAIPVAESLIAIIAFYYFKKGKWKMVKV